MTLAIAAGGPGAVFWMWVSALLGMASSFAECSLAQLYKERDSRGQFRGGPAWYMARGLGMRWMGVLFSILLLAYGFIFNTVQANSVAHALRYAFDLPAAVSGGVLAVVVLLAILRGLRGVARLMQWIVPFMALLWIATSLLIGLWHITALPTIFATIFRCAFGWQEAAAGAVGYTISQALTSGFQRGMFSNEAGMGSSPNAAAAAASWPPHPAAQGIVQMIGVFIDTIVICTASAIIVMLAPRPDNEYTLNGIQDLQHAMSVLVGGWGAGFIALIVLLFAFSSIVANYVYAENNLVFLRLDKPRYIWGLRILTVLMVLLGTMVSLPVVWQSADIIMALMAMTNLTAILLLSPTVRIIASDYLRQRRLGIQPTFDATRYPDIDQQLAPGAWNELPRE
ncbi:alanine/glycine transport protein [Klebsiella pneumoniae]|nr:alanine/glycine transport protein [Klebsiella pneumoniae]